MDAKGTPALGGAFVERIAAEATDSPAVNHPYLQAMRDGAFPDTSQAFRDFAYQYGLYSQNFIHYMSAVITALNCDEHQAVFLANIEEERGNAHDVDLPDEVLTNIAGQPHSLLYRRFQTAIGVTTSGHQHETSCPGSNWSRSFQQLCETSEQVGVGAIGIGTEFIVSRIFDQILDGLKAHSQLTLKERVFFELHRECDDKHAQEMLSITAALANTPAACEDIAHGVRTALAMRATFWDQMLVRALEAPPMPRHL